MSLVVRAEKLNPIHDDATFELLRLLARLRWRLGLERATLLAVRGAIGSGFALIALSAASLLTASEGISLWLATAPLLAAIGFAIARWPTRRQTALAADRQMSLDERLTTAVELISWRRYGRFDRLQIRDALARTTAAPVTWLALNRAARNEAVLAVGILVLGAISVVVLPHVPRPLPSNTPATEVAPMATDALQELALPLTEPPADTTAPTAPLVQPAQPQSAPDPNLASRVQQEQAEQTSLDQLAQALSSVSAGQSAAQAIQQRDFGAARDQLQNLGDEADQLSSAAKQQLSAALQQAAAATAQSDRQLANVERQAAQALARPSYVDQRQALRGLGDQVERSGARSVPTDQLQRELGQLQQQGGGVAQGAPDAQGDVGQQAAASQATAAGLSGAAPGQQGAPGVGTGAGGDLFGNQSSKLDTAGQSVQVPTRLGNGPGVRPADGTEDQSAADPSLGGQRVSQAPRAQQTGQVAPEQNLVPGEQRPVVRGYFR